MQHVMLQSLLVFAVSLTLETPNFGRSVESRTPLEEFFFVVFVFKCVYAHV